MFRPKILIAARLCCAASAICTQARADDTDALDLQAAPPATASSVAPLRLAVEVGVGSVDDQFAARTRDGHRVSVDLRYSGRISEAWRLAFSDRLDDSSPAPEGQHTTINSMREAYASWEAPGGATSFDLGRLNLRQGPAYGYNPTDFFRTGALRTITTADPVTLREIRMGTFMLRGSYLWSSGGFSAALAPKLQTTQDTRPAALDWGATNATDRALLALNSRLGGGFNGQLSMLLQRGQSAQLGGSLTGLLTDALVFHAEASSGRSAPLLSQLLEAGPSEQRNQRAAMGMTYTFPGALAVTLEAEYNGAGLDRAGWNSVLAQGPAAYQNYLRLTQPSQELGSRRAWLLYATQRSLGLKQLDLAGFVRQNAEDHSRLTWIELRYHWQRFDAALQWQRSAGSPLTEFGALQFRQVVQLLGTFYL